MEQCSLLLPLLWGAGPMALMLWLDGMMMMIMSAGLPTVGHHRQWLFVLLSTSRLAKPAGPAGSPRLPGCICERQVSVL
jgi:hypothetical protein